MEPRVKTVVIAMGEMWKADPRPVPAEGPAWPGDDERVTYKGLTVRPHADLEPWQTWDDRWEIGLASTGEAILVLRAERDRALSIAERWPMPRSGRACPDALPGPISPSIRWCCN